MSEILAKAIFVILNLIVAVSAQQCHLSCGPGHSCALVRHGSGPPVPDCVTLEEALLLEQAYQGGATGPGTGIGEFGLRRPHRRFFGHGRGFIGQRIGAGPVTGPFLPAGGLGVGPGFVGGGGSLGVFPSGGIGVVPTVGVDRPSVGVVNPGGVGPAVVEDRSGRLKLNININNNNVNQHDHSGGGGTQINEGTAGCRSCQASFECSGAEHCYFSPSCGFQVCQLL